jgi:hypothetical protein
MSECIRSGDADVIGLGVRLGVYLQLLAAFLTAIVTAFQQDTGPGMESTVQTTAVTALALLMTTTIQGARQEIADYSFIVAMAMLALQQIIVLCGMVDKRVLTSCGTRLFCYVITLWTYGLTFWFYSVGYRSLEQEACDMTYVFFFVRVPAYTWFRILTLFSCVIGVIYYFTIMCYDCALSAAHSDLAPDGNAADALIASSHDMVNKNTFRVNFMIGVCFSAALMVAIVEMTIKYNNIEGVNSIQGTGQFLALFAGIFVLVITIKECFCGTSSQNEDGSGGIQLSNRSV